MRGKIRFVKTIIGASHTGTYLFWVLEEFLKCHKFFDAVITKRTWDIMN